MSQNFTRGLENEYLLPYLEFTTSPTGSVLAGGGTTTLTAVATASTGIGYLKYRWYADDVLTGGITTALSGVTTSRDFTLDYSGDSLTRDVSYKVSAEWVPENPDIIVSHGTPGVGATGVGVGQSVSGFSPSGETFSSVGIVSVSGAITASLVAIGTQPIGFNTSGYNKSRTFQVNATISNGDNNNLVYVWKSGDTVVSGATTSAYTFTPGYVGVNTYTVTVSYPTDTLVPSVTSDNIIDNSTDLTQSIRLEYIPAGAEKVSSSADYKVYSEEVNLADYSDGFKIDLNHVQEKINSLGSRNTSTYAWANYYYVSMSAIDDDLTVDFEMGGASGAAAANGNRGGYGGWMVLQGVMNQNEEYVGIAATGSVEGLRPATGLYELGTVIGITANGGQGASDSRGGDGGADSPGEPCPANASLGSSGEYWDPNNLPVEGGVISDGGNVAGRASRCPKGDSWYQNRYGACETFTSQLRDPEGVVYLTGSDSDNVSITRGFKMTELYLQNEGISVSGIKGGSGAEGGDAAAQGGGGGSGYYGGNWTKKASYIGGNDGAVRTYDYGTGLTQTVTTDGSNGYIRIFGRGGTAGNNPTLGTATASVERNPSGVINGVYLDMTDFPTDKEVLVRFTRTNSNFPRNLTLALYTVGTYAYALQESSDISEGGLGTQLLTIINNQTQTEAWVTGGARYSFRTADDDGTAATDISAVFIGGEAYGNTASRASGGEFDITVLGGETSTSEIRHGTMADLSVKVSLEDIRDT